MEAINEYFRELLSWIPKEVVLMILLVVVFTELTKQALKKLEDYLESKKKKQIKFFDHTKIIFVTVWAIIASVLLAVAGVFTWQQAPLYFLAITGAAIVVYEYIVKYINKFFEDDKKDN